MCLCLEGLAKIPGPGSSAACDKSLQDLGKQAAAPSKLGGKNALLTEGFLGIPEALKAAPPLQWPYSDQLETGGCCVLGACRALLLRLAVCGFRIQRGCISGERVAAPSTRTHTSPNTSPNLPMSEHIGLQLQPQRAPGWKAEQLVMVSAPCLRREGGTDGDGQELGSAS